MTGEVGMPQIMTVIPGTVPRTALIPCRPGTAEGGVGTAVSPAFAFWVQSWAPHTSAGVLLLSTGGLRPRLGLEGGGQRGSWETACSRPPTTSRDSWAPCPAQPGAKSQSARDEEPGSRVGGADSRRSVLVRPLCRCGLRGPLCWCEGRWSS